MFFFFLPSVPSADDPTLFIYAESRERFESHQNPTFSSPAGKNAEYLYSRLRVGADLKLNSRWSGRLEYQNAHDLYWNQTVNASTDNSDLSLAYAKYTSADFTAIGGRQKIELGQQRLIGSTEWLNLARSFDAGRAESGAWDAWVGRLGVANTKPETARIDGLTHTDKVWGTTSFIEKHDLGSVSDTDIQTVDHFVTHKFGSIAIDAEGAVQYGSSNGRDQRAWAWHLRASQDVLPKTTLKIEGNAASGGGNATTSRTFDNLYPSNHDLYGLADLVGWKNMNELAVKLENKSIRSLTLQAEAHAFSLRDPSDAWYSAVGTVNARSGGSFVDPAGTSGVDLGREFDLQAIYSTKKYGTLTAGIAFFEPGNYVQNLSGHSNQLTYGFLQYQIRF